MRAKSGTIALWTGIGLVLGADASFGRAQPGPDDGGAVLRTGFDDPTPRNAPKSQASSAAPQGGDGGPTADQILAHLAVDPRYTMNNDIRPTPDLGPWMVCVHSYVTREAPEWARQMTAELRTNPKYRLPAYVFTYGLEERHKEYVRAKALLDQQRQFAKDRGLPIMYAPRSKNDDPALQLPNQFSLGHVLSMVGNERTTAYESEDLPLGYALNMLKVKHIPVQCAVLVGGYANENAAKSALMSIKQLPPPDPNRVKLDTKFYTKAEPKNPKATNGEHVYVNPFERAFVCRNPSIPQERVAQANDGMDMKTLQRLNNGEPYTLLNCKKPLTLAIKQFQTFTTIQTKDEPNVLQKFGFMTRGEGEGVDQAAHDGHNLVEYLRKSGLDAYVLHTKFSSVVTVGGYDSLQDPNLLAMQRTLSERLRIFENALRRDNPRLQSLMFFPQPMPMKVPH